MTSPPAGTAAAYLTGVRERLAAASPAHGFKDVDASQRDVPALAAALEAVLALSGEWEKRAAELRSEANPVTSTLLDLRAQSLSECANRAREAIEAALTGTQGGTG